MGDDYWGATDRILGENGGQGPPCGYCGKPMYPQDDHGRFFCGCGRDDSSYIDSLLAKIRRESNAKKISDDKSLDTELLDD